MRERCPRCRTRLDREARCPGTYELLDIKGERYGTAAQLVHNLGRNVTMAMVRNWSRQDRGDGRKPELPPERVGRKVYFQFVRAVTIERDKRLSGRGAARELDSALVGA